MVLAARQRRDRGWWDQMAAMYWPDAAVRLSSYNGDSAGFVAGSEAMAGRGAVALHHVFTPAVHARSDRAYVEAPVAMRIRVVVEAVPGGLVSYTRLNYRLERRAGAWRILSLDAVYCVPTAADAVYLPELLAHSRRLPSVHVHPVFTRTHGRLTGADVSAALPTPVSGLHTFICGPASMGQDITRYLRRHGPRDCIHAEQFAFR